VETYREQVVDEWVDVAVVHVSQSQEEAVQLQEEAMRDRTWSHERRS
jgi:hypothetical protein